MSHMVIFRTPEGKPGYQPAETVQDAVAVVERLRNDEGVENVRIFRLEEVQFELRPYYKVELTAAEAAAAEAAESDATEATDEGEGSTPAPSIFGGSESSADAPAGDAGVAVTDTTGTEADEESHESTSDVPPPPSAAHPPWASPPPPPAPVDPPSTAASSESGDELSGAGQRRGLFGR